MNDHSFAKLACKSTTPITFREFFSSYITRINPIARGIINYYCQVWSGYARHRGSLLRIFVAAMIQDIHPHRFDNRYHARKRPGRLDFILHYRENSVLLKNAGDRLEIPRMDDLPALEDQAETVFLFTFDDVSCFLLQEDPGAFGSQLAYRELGFFRTTRQQEIAWICLVGYHLANWYAQHRFCGKCGAPMTPGTGERAIACSACNHMVYPVIAPAVIVAITCRDRILLARGSNFPGSWYSLIAGYVDAGESLEEALVREVKEEVGLDIRNIRYYGSQPWPLSGSMMIGFTAEADDAQPIVADGREIAEAGWFSRGNLPKHSLSLSIAGEMIGRFDRGEL